MKNIEGSIGKKEEDYFTTAKKYLLDNPNELKDIMLVHFKKEDMNPRYVE